MPWKVNTRESILTEIDKSSATGCWRYPNKPNNNGYVEIRFNTVKTVSHRLVWQFLRGPIPDAFVLDHLCRNRTCCNPDHLEIVTEQVNILRGIGNAAENAKKTHCPRGHEYSGENVIIYKDRKRHCRTCERNWKQPLEITLPEAA
jgi:hypothetical protein